MSSSTLSTRGAEFASGPNMRDKASHILAKQWDPVNNPDGVVNIGTAENHLMFNDVAAYIKSKELDLQGPDFDYGDGPWGSLRLRTAFSRFINSRFHPSTPLSADNLTIGNGCSSLFNMLALTLADPVDGILLSMPSYVAFPSDFGLIAKMKPIFVPFNNLDQFSPQSIQNYEQALSRAKAEGMRIRILMLCNPHNPLGRCYPPATLIALLQFCNKHCIHLISDEIYAQSVYSTQESDTVPFTSVLSLDWEKYISKDYLHMVYGMSKDFACGGFRIGCLWTQNTELQRAMSAISEFHWCSTISEIMAATMLEDSSFTTSFLQTSRNRLSSANTLARQLLDQAGIRYATGANAGFFLWIDLSLWMGPAVDKTHEKEKGEWTKEEKLMQRLLEEKVFLTRGGMQASENSGWFRLVFSHKEVVLREGIRRLTRALGSEGEGEGEGKKLA